MDLEASVRPVQSRSMRHVCNPDRAREGAGRGSNRSELLAYKGEVLSVLRGEKWRDP